MKDLRDLSGPPELTDGRLRLRRLLPQDRALVVAALNDPLCERFLWRPPYPYTDADFDEFLAGRDGAWSREHTAHWLVARASDDAVLAAISLEIDVPREAAELGYWCAPWARGHSVMSGAARLVRDWAFDELGLERLELATEIDNIGSQHVAAAAGLRREGVMRGYLTARGRRTDDVLFGMTKADPREPVTPPFGAARLTDGRIEVRPFEPADIPAVRAACLDAAVAHWIFGVPLRYSDADAEAFVTDSWRSLAAGTRARLAIAEATADGRGGAGGSGGDGAQADGAGAGGAAPPAGRLLGSVSLDLFPHREAGEIGYWVAAEVRRQGVAEAAVRLVVHWGFQVIGLERLEIMTYPGNQASQALAEKMGFRREGLLRGYLAAEPGKDRAGRVEPAADASRPPRDDQVLFALTRADCAV